MLQVQQLRTLYSHPSTSLFTSARRALKQHGPSPKSSRRKKGWVSLAAFRHTVPITPTPRTPSSTLPHARPSPLQPFQKSFEILPVNRDPQPFTSTLSDLLLRSTTAIKLDILRIHALRQTPARKDNAVVSELS